MSAAALAGKTKGLAGKTSCDKVGWGGCELFDIAIDGCVRPMLFNNRLRKRLVVAKAYVVVLLAPDRLGRECEAPDAGE